ncbi:hypothetical protein PHMEG_00024753 [Phytophthora megakarya]|uniref:PiggyBac transposable element-derived protein domain-containing protein n=1 Tax=Phytophthora megakarya TaxID=4795 RepID=A0A225VF59_9STRA|nr:hypothetical protein PHMEG_00024753 [Phytophthora megakarya]
MARDRFMNICPILHFNANDDPRALIDRAWKIRKVADVLQRTIREGYVPHAELSFDEAMLPNRSSFNKMRVYMKAKPHKWGTKLFMLCSAHTAYCIRSTRATITRQTRKKAGGCRAEHEAVFGDTHLASKRLVVIDRFCTSVALAIQLLMMGFYCVGTIQTNRLGYCKEIICKKKTRPKDKDRGSCKISESTHVPGLRAICWMDFKPVHFLTCGGSVELNRVVRKDKTDYHKFMGGVDVHDQLRLQRYSIQRAVTFRKFYKSLFLGLIDMAIVNSYIVHKAYHKTKATRPLKHVKFMKKLQLQLTQLQESDIYEGDTFGDAEATATSGPVHNTRGRIGR